MYLNINIAIYSYCIAVLMNVYNVHTQITLKKSFVFFWTKYNSDKFGRCFCFAPKVANRNCAYNRSLGFKKYRKRI